MAKKTQKNPRGAGRKLIELDYAKAEMLASRGLGPTQIARAMGVSWDTINRNKKRNAEFAECLKRGKAKGLASVTNSLFKSATESGNVTAQIFYLKNQDPTNWSDRNEVNHNFNLKEILTNAKSRVIEGKIERPMLDSQQVLTKDESSND